MGRLSVLIQKDLKSAMIASMTITGPAITNYYENSAPAGLVGRMQ